MKRLIITADDFGLSESVNEAVERAHLDGILAAASLMVAAPAAADAVRRAKAMPSLRVGLHLVVIEGAAMLGGEFPSDQLRLGVDYFFRARARRRLRAEIEAQFAAFAATGLPLDHANAHKHMHLHPTVGRMLIEIGRAHGLRAIRIPAEPPSVVGGGRALHAWTRILRAQARRAGLTTNDHCFGIRWTGAMTSDRLLSLAPALSDGVSEIYCHPAAWPDENLSSLMPGYAHQAELAALLNPAVSLAFDSAEVSRIAGYAGIDLSRPERERSP